MKFQGKRTRAYHISFSAFLSVIANDVDAEVIDDLRFEEGEAFGMPLLPIG